jgi:putative acetyltransferase
MGTLTNRITLRDSRPDDWADLATLYPQAFPEEDLLPLVQALLAQVPDVLSLVGILDARVVGHGLFTPCGVIGHSGEAALLGPLAVAPAYQQQGVGTALVQTGLQRLAAGGVREVFVLGDPAYYQRFGFRPETAVAPPYPLPADWTGAWQSLPLNDAAPFGPGSLALPAPWLQPGLWAP